MTSLMTLTTNVLVTAEGVFDMTPYTRSDLQGRLPVVVNGRTAEEWYSMYAQLVLKLAKLEQRIEQADR